MKRLAAAGISFVCLVTSLQLDAQTYQKVYAFADETDGNDITSTLTMDRAGNFYGTSFSGGTSYGTACDLWGGCGLVFRLSPSGMKTTLHNFGLTSADGQNPKSGVVVDAAGNIYGTTEETSGG